jgi:hypothetical protein
MNKRAKVANSRHAYCGVKCACIGFFLSSILSFIDIGLKHGVHLIVTYCIIRENFYQYTYTVQYLFNSTFAVFY